MERRRRRVRVGRCMLAASTGPHALELAAAAQAQQAPWTSAR